MAQFEEQMLFQGAVQSQGYAPQQAPDLTPFLRENMEQVDRNFANLKSQRQSQLDATLKDQLKTLEMFGQFSQTAMKAAQVLGQNYIDNQLVEGASKMRSQMGYGVTNEQRLEYEASKATLKNEERTQIDPVVNDFVKNGEPLEAINFIKGLPHYQRIAATEYYLKQKGAEYVGARDQFFLRTDIQLDGPDGKFSPSQIDDDPVKANIALGAFSRLFLADNVGIGSAFNPNPVMMTSLYEAMDKADSTYMQKVRNNKAINDSLDQLRTAEQGYSVDNDIATMISRAHGAINPKTGKPMTRRDARLHTYDIDLNRYRAGDKEVFDKYKNTVAPFDPKGRTYFELYEKEFTEIGGIYDKIRAIDTEEAKQDDNARKIELDKIQQQIHDYAQSGTADDIDDPDFWIKLRQKLRPQYGELNSDAMVDRLEKTYRPDLLRDEQMEPMIKERAASLQLTDDFLDQYQVSYNMRTKYANEIAKSNAAHTKAVKDDEKSVRNSIRNVAKRGPDGTTDPIATLIESDLVTRFTNKVNQFVEEEGLSVEQASKKAAIEVNAFFDDQYKKPEGIYRANPFNGGQFDNFKKYLGIQGRAADNISKRYRDLNARIEQDKSILPIIKDGSLFSKSDLERISKVIERDPFLTSIDRKDPLYVPLTQAKALIKRTNPGLSLYKVLKQAYDANEDMEVPPVIEQIQPALDKLSPKQHRFINNLLNGTATSNEISRNILPIGQLPLRPGKEYANGLTGMAGLRGLTRSGEGGYTSMYPSESYPEMTNMTIRQVVELQKAKLKDGRASAAVGAYQFLYPEKAAQMAGLSLDDKFTPQNQDMMFDALITQKRPKIGAYLSGKSDDIDGALDELAMEFASFEYRGGTSYYNDGLNKASISRSKAALALRSAREEMLAGGMN